jgi:hypothetical protein
MTDWPHFRPDPGVQPVSSNAEWFREGEGHPLFDVPHPWVSGDPSHGIDFSLAAYEEAWRNLMTYTDEDGATVLTNRTPQVIRLSPEAAEYLEKCDRVTEEWARLLEGRQHVNPSLLWRWAWVRANGEFLPLDDSEYEHDRSRD